MLYKCISSTRVKNLKDLEKGDHIKIRKWGYLYAHHAIVTHIDDNILKFKVIHFTADYFKLPEIKEEELTFTDTSKILRVTYKIDEISPYTFKRLPHPASVAVAEYCVKNKDAIKSYNLITYNCEHFVFFCTLGCPISIQTCRPLFFACLALSKFDSSVLEIVFHHMMSNKTLFYNEGERELKIEVQSGKKVTITF